MSTADTLLHKGDGVTMTIRNGSLAHAVTLWGFSYSAPGAYTGIYITDSDDGVVALENYSVKWQSNAWYLSGRYSGWKISDVEALGFYASPSGLSGLSSLAGIHEPCPHCAVLGAVRVGSFSAALWSQESLSPGT